MIKHGSNPRPSTISCRDDSGIRALMRAGSNTRPLASILHAYSPLKIAIYQTSLSVGLRTNLELITTTYHALPLFFTIFFRKIGLRSHSERTFLLKVQNGVFCCHIDVIIMLAVLVYSFLTLITIIFLTL